VIPLQLTQPQTSTGKPDAGINAEGLLLVSTQVSTNEFPAGGSSLADIGDLQYGQSSIIFTSLLTQNSTTISIILQYQHLPYDRRFSICKGVIQAWQYNSDVATRLI